MLELRSFSNDVVEMVRCCAAPNAARSLPLHDHKAFD